MSIYVFWVGIYLSWWSIGPARRRRWFDSPLRQGFFPESFFSVDSLTVSVHSHIYAIACTYAHVIDLVVDVRARWIMEKLKHSACSAGWVARLCCNWLSPGKATRIFQREIPLGRYGCKKFFLKKKKRKKRWMPTKVKWSLATVIIDLTRDCDTCSGKCQVSCRG